MKLCDILMENTPGLEKPTTLAVCRIVTHVKDMTPSSFFTVMREGGRAGCAAATYTPLLDFLEKHHHAGTPYNSVEARAEIGAITNTLKEMFPDNVAMSKFCRHAKSNWEDYDVVCFPVGTRLRHNTRQWTHRDLPEYPSVYMVTKNGMRPLHPPADMV